MFTFRHNNKINDANHSQSIDHNYNARKQDLNIQKREFIE